MLGDALDLNSLFLVRLRIATSIGIVVSGHGLVHVDGLILQLDWLQYSPLHYVPVSLHGRDTTNMLLSILE